MYLKSCAATIALLTVAALPAHAQVEVTVGGYTAFQAGLMSNDVAAGTSRDFQSEAEVHIRAKGEADSGLQYGAHVEIQASASDTTNVDESNIWLSGSWGRLELGDQDGAGSELAELAPFVGIGQIRGSYIDFIPAADRVYAASETGGDPNIKAIDTADATKVTYYTPRLAGVQAGVSYAPERDSAADGEAVQFSTSAGDHDNAVELGLNYRGDVAGVGLRLGGQYTMASAKSGSGLEDIRAWSIGSQLSHSGFSIGGSYGENGDSGMPVAGTADNVSFWTAGATYSAGSWGVGASYTKVDFETSATPFGLAAATGAGGEYQAYGAGVTYRIAPGLTTGLDAMWYERNRVTGADTNGHVVLTEVRAVF